MAGAAARAIERGGLFVRVLRTLGGRNIGKCRLRAHQHPLSPPLSNLLEPARAHPMQNIQGKTRASARDERVLGDELGDVWGCVLKIGCFVHRFLISGGQFENRCRVFHV